MTISSNNQLSAIIQCLNRSTSESAEIFNRTIANLLASIAAGHSSQQALKEELRKLLNTVFFVDSLTDAGINSNRGFFPELKQRIKYRILPPIDTERSFKWYVKRNFTRKTVVENLNKISNDNWNTLFQLSEAQTLMPERSLQIKNALVILVHRLVTIGIDPYIVSKLKETDDYDSPFFKLNQHIQSFLEGHISREKFDQCLTDCSSLFDLLEEKRNLIGVSLHFTFLLRRAKQHIERIQLLLDVYMANSIELKQKIFPIVLKTLIVAEIKSGSIREFYRENTDLLANRIASQTSPKGSKYIGFSSEHNKKILWSSIGGGAVVVILVYVKFIIHHLHLPLLPEGILYGLNYGIGFLVMHFLHLSLATKQPALTASYIAEKVELYFNGAMARQQLSAMLAQIIRSQLVSLAGNLLMVVPLTFLISKLIVFFTGETFLTGQEAASMLESNHPFFSGSLLFAVLTGVFLTLAGLAQGYYDNKVVFDLIPERINAHPFLNRFFPRLFVKRLSKIIELNSGVIAGSLILGFLLGSTGNIGEFIGIPLDIRHVTISSGYFAMSIAQGYLFSKSFILITAFGILLIGMINIISSFMFSFIIACRSRYLRNDQIWKVLRFMFADIVRNPGMLIREQITKDVNRNT